jgi:23S rRNA pseudouridine1911/1915/1917 synthase
MTVEILQEDEDILVCIKPQGVATQSDKSMDMDLMSYLKNQIFKLHPDQGEPELYVVHRLDRPVGGIVVFAKNKKAAAELTRQIQAGEMEKYYQAVLTGELPDWEGTLVNYLAKNGVSNTSSVVSKDHKDAKRAELNYEVLDVIETDEGILSYVLIELITGRHHQIRVQMAHCDAGIWGDTKYNPDFQNTKKVYRQIGLYATQLSFIHPTTGKRLRFKTEPEGEAFDLLDVDEV